MPAFALGRPASAALERLATTPKYEVLPLAASIERAVHLPRGAEVAVTASPARGLDATLQVAVALQQLGFAAVAHLAARMIVDARDLRRVVSELRAGGVERVFVVGGDAPVRGAYPDGLSLLRGLAEAGDPFSEIGIPCYPQGHPAIPQHRLLADLEAKQPYADYMTTQLCFDADALTHWLRQRRNAGCELPVDIGVAGAVEITRLLKIGAKIGVKGARRFVAANRGFLTRLLRPRGFRPDRFLEAIAPMLADPAMKVRRLHLYTFNSVGATERWRRRFLRQLRR